AVRRARRTAGDGADPWVRRCGATRGAVGDPSEARRGSAMGGDRRDPGGDGLLQLAGAPGQPPRADVVALPRAPSLPGGHERPDGLPDSSTDPRLVPAGRGPGPGA